MPIRITTQKDGTAIVRTHDGQEVKAQSTLDVVEFLVCGGREKYLKDKAKLEVCCNGGGI